MRARRRNSRLRQGPAPRARRSASRHARRGATCPCPGQTGRSDFSQPAFHRFERRRTARMGETSSSGDAVDRVCLIAQRHGRLKGPVVAARLHRRSDRLRVRSSPRRTPPGRPHGHPAIKGWPSIRATSAGRSATINRPAVASDATNRGTLPGPPTATTYEIECSLSQIKITLGSSGMSTMCRQTSHRSSKSDTSRHANHGV